MKKVSDKQAARNREIARIKSMKPKVCEICGRPGNELSHRLPKSLYPEYYTEPRNLQVLCHDCHYKYDNELTFRQRQTKIFRQLLSFDENAARRYFKIYE